MLIPARQTNSSLPGSGRGFSLIELMLAMLIGIIIIGGVMSLYISTRNTQRSSEDQLQLLADARFVINTIAYDLRHSGYWGETDLNRSITCRLNDTRCKGTSEELAVATGDCFTTGGWYIDLEKPMIASDNASPYTSTCTTKAYKVGTDVLGVHYADANTVKVADLATGITFVRSNYELGGLFIGKTIPTGGAFEDMKNWENNDRNNRRSTNRRLMSNLYYISSDTDGIVGQPSLHRVELQAGPIMKDSVLIPGVVDLQFEFGIDTDSPMDASTNAYVSVAQIPLDQSGATNWGRVRSVKIWVLMRSARADLDGITSSQTFTLANNAPVTYNNGFRHYLVTSIVNLRNTLELDITGGTTSAPGP